MSRRLSVSCLSLLLSIPFTAAGREIVTFTSGFCFEAESHTLESGMLRFRVGKGVLEFPQAEVSKIETLPETPLTPLVESAAEIDQLLSTAAQRAGLEPEFVKSVAKAESALQPNAVSKKGAQGLMQLMPATAKDLGVDPRITLDNAQGGANYLRALLLRYHGDGALALAAYNAGAGAVAKYGGVPPFQETRSYVLRVLKEYARLQTQLKRAPSQAARTQVSKPNATN